MTDDDVLTVACAADLVAFGAAAPTDEVEAIAARLARRWAEPHRAYHTPRHLAELLTALAELSVHGEAGLADQPRLRVAAWYHDAVYDPAAGPGANEEASAVLAVDDLDALHLEVGDIEAVAALVSATASHDWGDRAPVPGARAFLDADLWILSAPRQRYEEYTAQVRQEYLHVSDAAFRAGRSRLLRGLVDRPHLYATAHARAAWEPAARLNLTRELDGLA